jgi:4-carboxymuconolactone decarboxylase
MPETTSETPVLDLLASMTEDSMSASSLDDETFMLVRLAALVAVDAPSVSYLLNLAVAGELNIDADRIRGVLAAVAPIVGTPRVASATGKIVEALAVELEIAAMAEAEEGETEGDEGDAEDAYEGDADEAVEGEEEGDAEEAEEGEEEGDANEAVEGEADVAEEGDAEEAEEGEADEAEGGEAEEDEGEAEETESAEMDDRQA